MNQTYPATHFMVADGFPNEEIDHWKVQHCKLPPLQNFGNTPRCVGAVCAKTLGFDALLFLDADNWFEPDHIETLISIQHQYQVQVVTATLYLRREDGSLLGLSGESDGVNFADPNSLMLMREIFSVNMFWVFNNVVGPGCDRLLWKEILKLGYTHAHSTKPTVNYVTTYAPHYTSMGERPPKNAKVLIEAEDHQYRLIPYWK